MRNPFRRARPEPEKRSIDSVPWSYGGPSYSGGVTQERALSLAPVFAATRLIAESVSTLPLDSYRKLGETREPMANLPQLFDLLMTSGQLPFWVHRCVTSRLLRGEAIGLVTSRDGMQFPTGIYWLNPSEVHVDEANPMRPRWFWLGREVPAEDIVHIPWYTLPGRVRGLSPIAYFAATIGVGLSSQSYANAWFDTGGFPPGKFKNSEQEVDATQADIMRQRLVASMRTGQPLVYGRDWEYTPISVPPEEAQFVESSKLTATQIAAIYGVPPEKVGGEVANSLTYSTREQNALDFATFTVRTHTVVLEQVFASQLPSRQYVRFNLDALLRADSKTRWEVHRIAREIGARSVDEIRALEDMQPLPAGQGADFAPLSKPEAPDAVAATNGDESQAGRALLRPPAWMLPQ